MRKEVTQLKDSNQHNALTPSQPAGEREEVAAIHICHTADVWIDKCNQRVHKGSYRKKCRFEEICVEWQTCS